MAAVATVAAVLSYEHQRILATDHGQPDLLAALWPLAVDGLILACGIQVATDRAAGYHSRLWALLGFWLGVIVSVAANALATPGGIVARMISAFPAVALLIAVESLTTRPRRKRTAETVSAMADSRPEVPAEAVTTIVVADRKPEAEASQVSALFPHPEAEVTAGSSVPEVDPEAARKSAPSDRKPTGSPAPAGRKLAVVKRTPETVWAAAQEVMTVDPELPFKTVAERVGVSDRRLRQIRAAVA